MLLELENIYKNYGEGKSEVQVLKDISLCVDKGEYVAIMGPSGSGKSTLMNIIGCLDVPSKGIYRLNGEEISGKSDNELAQIRNQTIGFVFQNFNLMPRETAQANVGLPMLYAGVRKKERMQKAYEALKRVGLEERTLFKPTQLSGGQKQRVAIARAMVMNPSILLADEPTGALDSAAGEQVMKLFSQLNKEGVTIIMITHEQEIADHANRLLYIRDGILTEKK